MEGQTSPLPDLYVQLGVLDGEKLKRCLEFQETFRKQGLSLSLDHVILNLGMARPEAVAKVLAHQNTASLRCPKCSRRFTVPDFQANRRYKCEPCMTYLEIVVDEALQAEVGALPPAPGAVAGIAPTAAPLDQTPPTTPGLKMPPPKPVSTPRPSAPALPLPPSAPGAKRDPFEGRQFGGKYRILRRLAKGGMGAVYLAESLGTNQQVAVKILTEEFSRMPGIQGRFKREASTTGRLEHPSIVATIEMAKEENYTYIVMEYVDGGSLVDLIVKERKVSPLKTVEIMVDVLSGLHHAHQRGIIHRDIKPANVLLTSQGKAKVIDFGLAKDAEAQTILTLSGNVVGTPAYMAPEQAKGDGSGPLADLYSCGILTFLLLTGRKPFEGKSLVDTLNKQIHDPLPSIRATTPEVPDALEDVVKKMCAKEPAKRHKSPAEAAKALRKAMNLPVDESAGEEPPPEGESEPVWATVAGVLATGVAVWALLYWVMTR